MNTYYQDNRDRIIKNSIKWQKENRIKCNEGVTRRRKQAMDKIFDYLGRECVLCKFNNIDALCFDHINNNGSANRKKFGHATLEYLYYSKHLEEAKEMLQVLCYNCNMIKEKERRRNI